MWREKLRKIFWVLDGNWAHDLPWDIYINSLSCSEVNRHLTGTVTFESDFFKPNEHMVPQSRRFTDVFMMGDTNLTPTIQSTVCKISTQPLGVISSLALDVSTLNLVSFLASRRWLSSSVDRYSLTGLNQTLRKTRKCLLKLAQPTTYPSLK